MKCTSLPLLRREFIRLLGGGRGSGLAARGAGAAAGDAGDRVSQRGIARTVRG